MKPLRIALLSPFPPFKGGIARFSDRLRQALQAAGCEVLPVPFRRLWPRWLLKGRPATEPGAEPSASTPLSLDLMNPFTWFSVARQLRRSCPDVLLVACWSGLLAPLLAFVRRLGGLPTVVLLHNFTAHESIPGDAMLKCLLVSSSDGFLTLSRSVESELLGFSPDARTCSLFHPLYESQAPAPSGADARRRLGLPEDAPVLLFFGYVREYKGLDTLLEAMAAVVRELPAARLMVAGEFFLDSSRFREEARRLGIERAVVFREGYVPAGEVATLMAAADAVVLPYRSATQSGVAPLAFGHGVPVIACSAGGLEAQVEHGRTGWLVRQEGAEALAEGIVEFFRERDRLPLEEGIAEVCRKLSWQSFAAEAVAFLETCSRRSA
ncbi:glycosyltransferase [Chlorobaculum sp. 24CR]|uniref:glycosyltransferase n=1 Tax=Chlorobaculum sp. 24CR TaxID=2508878 RepID=UPI00100ACBAC|nr:glycosyltransferase [Chlorobaculum sp. 24CR]RXK88796.1 glycosyltransferase [Chlorobaculum sp. 24CR]